MQTRDDDDEFAHSIIVRINKWLLLPPIGQEPPVQQCMCFCARQPGGALFFLLIPQVRIPYNMIYYVLLLIRLLGTSQKGIYFT